MMLRKKPSQKTDRRKPNRPQTDRPTHAPNPTSNERPTLSRVQVKCSTQLLNGLYRVNAHRRTQGRAVLYLPSEIDFFAVYIIPILATRGRTSLLFRRRRDPKPGLYDQYREAWRLLRPQE